MDPLVEIYERLPWELPALGTDGTKNVTKVASDKGLEALWAWTYYAETRGKPQNKTKADVELMKGLVAWWALQRLGQIKEAFGLPWDIEPNMLSQAVKEARALSEDDRSDMLSAATNLGSIKDIVAQAYAVNSLAAEILSLYIKGPSKVPDPTLLSIALSKLPTQQDLGFTVPTFRVVDKDGVEPIGRQFDTGKAYPLNGGGSRSNKATSTSVGYNTFTTWAEAGAMLFVYGKTGRYIGCFGEYPAVDGAEILFGPEAVVEPVKKLKIKLSAELQTTAFVVKEVESAPITQRERRAYFEQLGY